MTLLASCTSPIVKRIERNPEIYNALSDKHKSLVQSGQVTEGMTKQAVFLSWGKPDRAAKGAQKGKTYERWSYTRYESVPAMSPGIGYGGAYGYGHGWGHGYGYGYYDPVVFYEPLVAYLPYEGKRVEFLNGRVAAWSVAR